MCEAAEVVGEAVGPAVLVWTLYEVAVFQGVAGHLINDGVGRTRGVVGHQGDRWLRHEVFFGSYQEERGVGVAGACGGITEGDRTGCVPGM